MNGVEPAESPYSLDTQLSHTFSILDEFAKKYNPEIHPVLDRFKRGCEKIYDLYQNGGERGGYVFRKCDLFDHDWHHVANDIEMVAKFLPGFLQENPGYQTEDIENLLYTTLLHDIGWLRTEEKADKELYKWGGEKFFTHCFDSIARAPGMLKNLFGQLGITGDSARFQKIAEMIRITEFNKINNKDEPNLKEERDKKLAEVLARADFFGYVVHPDQIPLHVQALYKESQAIARYDCERTRLYFESGEIGPPDNRKKVKDNILAELQKKESGLTMAVLEERFKNNLLTIANIKFPGQNVLEFVGSDFLPSQRYDPKNMKWLLYLQSWYGLDKSNEDLINYDQNIERIKALRALANTSAENPPQPAVVNPLCFFESVFTGRDLRTVYEYLKSQTGFIDDNAVNQAMIKQIESDKDYWDILDRKTLGIESTSVSGKLVTYEITKLLTLTDKMHRAEVLAYMMELFIKKQALNRPKEKERRDVVSLAIAPLAYQWLEDGYEEPEEDIFKAFGIIKEKYAGSSNNIVIDPVWTVRRNVDFTSYGLKWEQYAERIFKSGARKVVFAGWEKGGDWTEDYSKFVNQLVEKDTEVLIIAGQGFKGVAEERGIVSNNKAVIELAKADTTEKIKLVGLQTGITKEMYPDLLKLAEFGQLIYTYSSDLELGNQFVTPLKDIKDHTAYKLLEARMESGQSGLIGVVADIHDFFPSSVELEAMVIVIAMFKKKIADSNGEITWADYTWENYCDETRKLLASPS